MKIYNGGQEFDILVGADPEFFVTKDGAPISAHNLVPGTKDNPFKVEAGAVQVDGMALEFNINPADSEEAFLKNLDTVMDQILKMVPEYKYFESPVADFGADYIEMQPKEAKELGCDPDFNAYTMEPNPRPEVKTPFRTASGHVHIGWTKDVDPYDPGHFSACARLARMLDYTVGVPSLLWDKDSRRRELYGKAGAFRPKPYGMEYRTLSNVWLTPTDKPEAGQPGKFLRKYVYHQTIEAIKLLFDNPGNDKRTINGKTTQQIINSGDWESAFYAVKYTGEILSPASFR